MEKDYAQKKAMKLLQDSGVTVIRSDDLIDAQYSYIEFMVDVDEKNEVFYLLQFLPFSEEKITEKQMRIANEVILEDYEGYEAVWNDGVDYLSSPAYSLADGEMPSKEDMKRYIEEFDDAWTFFCMNINLALYVKNSPLPLSDMPMYAGKELEEAGIEYRQNADILHLDFRGRKVDILLIGWKWGFEIRMYLTCDPTEENCDRYNKLAKEKDVPLGFFLFNGKIFCAHSRLVSVLEKQFGLECYLKMMADFCDSYVR